MQIASERYFAPHRKIWQVNREMVLLAAGGRALLMQLAHPKVAAGVAEHSRFQDDPFGRLHRTMSTMWSIVFDPRAEARAALDRVETVHGRVHGSVSPSEPCFGGADYDALDPALLLWVHATLVDTAMVAYDRFVAPMEERDKAIYYDDSRELARLFGIDERIIPAGLTEFEQYMGGMLGGDMIAVGPVAKRLGRDVLFARPWVFKAAGPLFRFVTAALLPEKLREGYGLTWNQRRAKIFSRLSAAARATLPWIPARMRVVPNAREAEKQIRDPYQSRRALR
jgi:uncharacterized protein (DUF2236 family)